MRFSVSSGGWALIRGIREVCSVGGEDFGILNAQKIFVQGLGERVLLNR